MKRLLTAALVLLILFPVFSRAQTYAPGRLIVKIEPEAADGWLSEGSTGRHELDDYLNFLGIIRARRLAKERSDDVNRELRRKLGVEGILAFRYRNPIDPRAAAEDLGSMPGVAYAHPDYYAELTEVPDDPFYEYQYAMTLMQMAEAWDVEKGSEEVVIGVSDTGTDWDHPDLAENIYVNAAEDLNGNGRFDNYPSAQGGDLDGIDADGNGYVDDVIGWDFITGEYPQEGEDGYPPDPDPMDFGGHGTNTAGIASAVTNNGLMIAGTAWHCKVMPLKILYSATQGSGGIASDIIESFYYAADNNVDILSMSWRNPDTEALQEACVYANAAGVLLIASAGNDDSDTWHTPSAYPEVLSVAATQMGDMKADFSNYGSWVGIAAPGVDIWTTAYDDTFETGFGGTSASCPYVAGVAGLVKSRFPDLTNTEIYYRLTGTADQIDLINPTHRGKLGSGRVNGYRALTEEPHPTLRLVEIIVDDATGGNGDGLLGPGETAILQFNVRNFWEPAFTVTGYLSTTDSSVTVDTTAVIQFGSIPTDSTILSQGGATVQVSIEAEIGYYVPFVLTLYTEGGYVEVQPFGVPMAEQFFADGASSYGFTGSGRTHTVAFADFDGDGDIDFYRASWSYDHGLFRNDGDVLVDVTNEWGLPTTGKGQGTSWGDYDNDGDPDLLHGTLQGLALFRNDGEGNGFVEVTTEAGLFGDVLKDFAPVWGDYDGDGWLDFYVAHQKQDNLLFRNNGDGTFAEVGESAGVNSSMGSYGANFTDFDRDGDLDLFLANAGADYNGEQNELFVNQGDGTFEEKGLLLGVGEEALVSTGGVWGDYDNDGWLDLHVTNIGPSFNGGEPNKLFRNIRGKGFVRQVDSGIEDVRSSSGAAWGDFDGDGLLDLYVCNTQRNALFRNLGGGLFGDATESATIIDLGVVVAWMDLNGDGNEDIYVGRGGADQLLINLSDPHQSLSLTLGGAASRWGSCRDASRARVTLSGQDGSLTRIVGEGSGLGQGSPVLTLPLEPVGDEPVLTIAWPGGTVQREEVSGEGDLSVIEQRAPVDLALRAVVLPIGTAPGGATIGAVINTEDNGVSPLNGYRVRMDVLDEGGGVIFADSVEIPAGETDIAFFPILPAPLQGQRLEVVFTGIADSDDISWNNTLVQWIEGTLPIEEFEQPPVYWQLSQGWRWATSAGEYPANSGRGFLLLPSGPPGEFAASMPPQFFECGSQIELAFYTMYSLGQDTVWVNAWIGEQLIDRKALTGTQQGYQRETLRLNVGGCIGNVGFSWSCSRSDTTYPGWFFSIDDVIPVFLVGGDENVPLPEKMIVSEPWPNPSTETITWKLALPNQTDVELVIYSISGRMIANESLGEFQRGSHLVTFSPKGLSSGVYMAKFVCEEKAVSRLFVRLK